MGRRYKDFDAGNSQPATFSAAITPSDSVALPNGVCRGIYVGTAGNVQVVYEEGAVDTFNNVPAGTILPVFALRVNATGTTASNMNAMY